MGYLIVCILGVLIGVGTACLIMKIKMDRSSAGYLYITDDAAPEVYAEFYMTPTKMSEFKHVTLNVEQLNTHK